MLAKQAVRGVVPRIPPLTRPDTLAMSLLRKDAGSDHGRPNLHRIRILPQGNLKRASDPASLTGRDGSTEAVNYGRG